MKKKSKKRKSSKKANDATVLAIKDIVPGATLYEATIDPGTTLLELPHPLTETTYLTVIAMESQHDSNFTVTQKETNYSTSVGAPAEWTQQ